MREIIESMGKSQVFTFLVLGFLYFSCSVEKKEITSGVSFTMAQQREEVISKVFYDLNFNIPLEKSSPVEVQSIIQFNWKENEDHLLLDFNVPQANVVSIVINGKNSSIQFRNGHLVIDRFLLKKGANTIEIKGFSSDQSLNRNDDYLYTLFVPDRASTAFPCFDQPNIKARYRLTLTVPKEWEVLGPTTIESVETQPTTKTISFGISEPISTYLFSFVTGQFKTVKITKNDMEMNLLYREGDSALLKRNVQEIFDLHISAVDWLEEYLSIDFPFSKLDFVAIPGFQYGGMEHVGAIQYRADLLFLDESASVNQKLRRANLIAHETAHMWFGNLVTMKWFDDVWMKEVFANFLADKIVREAFPEVPHLLNFLFAHYPAAYEVDRTEGANAIQQPLDNLNNAGNMYGSIIYHKAPIAMRQLELMVGENALRLALKDYMDNYTFDNANWDDLTDILERISNKDITQWSNVWIRSAGMPVYDMNFVYNTSMNGFEITQTDPQGKGRVWPQVWNLYVDYEGGPVNYKLALLDSVYQLKRNSNNDRAKFFRMNNFGFGYGVFIQGLEYVKGEMIFDRARIDISAIESDIERATAYVNMHEFLLHEGFHPQLYYTFLEVYIEAEQNELILSYLLDNLTSVFNRFMDAEMKLQNVKNLEFLLWNKLQKVESQSIKSELLEAYMNLAQSDEGVRKLKALYDNLIEVEGLELSKSQREKLALNITLKSSKEGMPYFEKQLNQTNDSDKKAKLEFIRPVFSTDSKIRDQFFESLKLEENRVQETWVLTALRYLHHPDRNEASIHLIKPSLELLEEIRVTGDIFFPKRWMDRTLYGYNSKAASEIVRGFLNDKPDLNYHLKMKLLQSSDMLFRANENLAYYESLKND